MTESGPSADATHLLRECRYATLATIEENGAPLATLVAVATDACGRPLLLLSGLARHTANLARDCRASLLLDGSAGAPDRLAASRLSLVGEIRRLDAGDESWRASYLARHPEAVQLLGLSDFHPWRMEPALGHLVAGFGRIATFEAATLLVPAALAEGLGAIAQRAIDHMHDDHLDAVAELGGGEGARIVALDADGLDLVGPEGPVRRSFCGRLESPEDLRAAVVELVRNHRKS